MSGVSEGHHLYLHWGITDFGGGYIDGVEDSQLPENASKDCRSVISKTIGSLESRPGQLAVNATNLGSYIQGLHPYYFGNDRALMMAYGGHIGHWDFPSGSFTQLATGYQTTVPVLFESCVNYVVGFNGHNAPWKWDGSTFSALANAPAKGRYPVLHKEKLFCADTENLSTLRWSDSFLPETWPGVNYWDIKKGDGDIITALVKFIGELIIFKKRSTHTLKGTSLDDFSLQELDSKIGAVGPRAVTQYKNHLYVISDNGIFAFNGIKYVNLTSLLIPKLWSGVNQAHLDKAVAWVWDELIFFAIPTGSSTFNNLLLVYSLGDGELPGVWWPWTGLQISWFTAFNNGTTVKPYTGHAQTGWLVEQGVGRSDVGLGVGGPQMVGAYWESKYFDFQKAGTEKKAKRAFIEVSQDTGALNPKLTISKDYEAYEDLALERSDSMIRQYRFVNRDRWRYLSIRFEEVALGGFDVRSVLVPFKPKAKPKVRGGSIG